MLQCLHRVGKFLEVLGRVCKCFGLFGYVWMPMDASGRVRMRLDVFRIVEVDISKNTCFLSET